MSCENENRQHEMSFWAHLDALRTVLFKIAGVLFVAIVLFFILMPDIFDNVILAPCRGDFILYRLFSFITSLFPDMPQFSADGFEVKLINIQLASQFFIHLSTSFWLALIFTFPLVIYLLWGFVRPALYSREIRAARIAFSFGVIMFYAGIAVGYLVVFPVTLRFLAEYQVSLMVPNQISLDSYMDNFLMLIFLMGVVFEMPLLAWALSAVGVLHRSFFVRYRRHAIVVLLVLAALITPTGDPFTLSIVFLPLYGLFEMSAFFVKKEKMLDNE